MIVPELILQDEAPREGLFLADFDAPLLFQSEIPF